MNTNKILIVSAHPQGIDSWPAHFETVFATTDEAAIEVAQQQPFEAIVVDATDEQLHSAKLHAVLPILQPEATLFRHSGTAASVKEAVQDHFRRRRNERIRRFLVLDEVNSANLAEPPAFSAN